VALRPKYILCWQKSILWVVSTFNRTKLVSCGATVESDDWTADTLIGWSIPLA
jgi:hypothetical protein